MDHSSVFDEVIFTELGRNEAEILVKQYNAEGEAAKPPPEKRSRFSDSFSGGSNTGSARDRFSSGSTGRDYGDTGWRDRDRSPSNARYSGHDKRDDWRGDFRQERGRGRGYGDYRGRGYEDRGDRDRFDRDSRGRGRTGGFRGARGRGGGGYGSGFGASGDDFGYNRGGYGGQRGGRGGGGYDNYSHDDRGAGFRRGGPPRGGSRSGSGSGYQPSEDKYKSEYATVVVVVVTIAEEVETVFQLRPHLNFLSIRVTIITNLSHSDAMTVLDMGIPDMETEAQPQLAKAIQVAVEAFRVPMRVLKLRKILPSRHLADLVSLDLINLALIQLLTPVAPLVGLTSRLLQGHSNLHLPNLPGL
ncbi:unnamed protein product [Protopolystoma xenopodis]|uniref:Uncharacterized protein n=1 Tax=Protopolystoma xenopodis TaxID=117903 RepID=A0A448X4W9_9PLAT|nr:unnamed protein product [Protopolystoma xenopodis]